MRTVLPSSRNPQEVGIGKFALGGQIGCGQLLDAKRHWLEPVEYSRHTAHPADQGLAVTDRVPRPSYERAGTALTNYCPGKTRQSER